VLAKGRTELAFIRTGLAFVALGIALIRYFGLGPWTLLDGGLVVFGAVATVFGLRGFMVTRRLEKRFTERLNSFLNMTADLGTSVES
jgi:uncharacterized membrane protein YidH (DUF202 family)